MSFCWGCGWSGLHLIGILLNVYRRPFITSLSATMEALTRSVFWAFLRAGTKIFFRISRTWKGRCSPILMLDSARRRRWLQTWSLSARQVKRTIIGLGRSLWFFPKPINSAQWHVVYTLIWDLEVILQYILHDVMLILALCFVDSK